MITAQVVVRKSDLTKSNKLPLWMRFTKDRKLKFVHLQLYCPLEDWDFKIGRAKDIKLNTFLLKQMVKANDLIIRALENDWDLQQIAEAFSGEDSHPQFFKFADLLIAEMKEFGRIGNSRNTSIAVNQLRKIYPEELTFGNLDYTKLKKFKDKKSSSGISNSTISNYLRVYRAIFNEAINRDTIDRSIYPFKKGLIPPANTTVKKNLSPEQIKLLLNLEIKNKYDKKAVDLWILCFSLRGMDLVDLLHLKWNQVNGKHLTYYRKKLRGSGKEMKIYICPIASSIIKQYSNKKSSYVLGLIRNDMNLSEASLTHYLTVMSNLTRRVKRIAKVIDTDFPVTSKATRHTFATIAKRAWINREIIKEMMGHQDRDVTGIYEDQIEQQEIDVAHKRVLKISFIN